MVIQVNNCRGELICYHLSLRLKMVECEDIHIVSMLTVLCESLSCIIDKCVPFCCSLYKEVRIDLFYSFPATLTLTTVQPKFPLKPSNPNKFVAFQSSQAPEVTVSQYLARIQKYSKCSDSCFLLSLIYIDRLVVSKGLKLTILNIHRVLISW